MRTSKRRFWEVVGRGLRKEILRWPSTARLGSNWGTPGMGVAFWAAMKSTTSWVAPLKAAELVLAAGSRVEDEGTEGPWTYEG